MSPPSNPSSTSRWNFDTFEKFINQRFVDLSMQLRERYEAQQTGVTAALAAAEKAVNAALIAAEKAVDKAEGAQQLRNEAQNEFRKSLSDLSGLMWTIKEGTLAVDSVRREFNTAINNNSEKISALEHNRADATETLRKSVEGRIGNLEANKLDPAETMKKINFLENGYANIQGRIWSVSALFAVAALGVTLAVTVAVRFIGH